MNDDLGVGDVVFSSQSARVGEGGGDGRSLEAFDGAAFVADEMGVRMTLAVVLARGAGGVAPGAIFAADAVDELVLRQGVERAVNGDRIGVIAQQADDVGSSHRLE